MRQTELPHISYRCHTCRELLIWVFQGSMRCLGLCGAALGSVSAFQGSSMCWSLHWLDLSVPGFDEVFEASCCYGRLDFIIPGLVDMPEPPLAHSTRYLVLRLAQFWHSRVCRHIGTFVSSISVFLGSTRCSDLQLARFWCSRVR